MADTVEFLGWRDDVRQLMAQSDLRVMPSKDEGLPNAVQEAMYIGLPVIVSDTRGMPEFVWDGKTGWVRSLGDPQAWADRIAACARSPDLCEAVGRAAAEYAASHFDTETWGKEYVRIIQEITHCEEGQPPVRDH